MVSPANIIITPTYMGLREYLYNPKITSFFVGSRGDNVPFPSNPNLAMHIINITSPNTNNIIPKYCQTEKVSFRIIPDSFFRMSHGTSPATTPGCKIVKNRLRKNNEVIVWRPMSGYNFDMQNTIILPGKAYNPL